MRLPGAVLNRGACCSGTSRLYILCLTELGLRAHQVTLYHSDGNAQHCLIEILLPDGPLIADPSYGFYYTAADGAPIGLEALQRGVTPLFRPLPQSSDAAYPSGSYYDFDFRQTKTANWTKSWPRRTAYQVLSQATDGSVDRLRVPAILEWPQMLLALLLTSALAAMHLGVQLIR